MSLAAGTPLGPYEIVAPIGAGGMGEVYRARDTKLHRDVAIKVLPEAFALDAERLARFTREAQVLASLNHPNIAAVYGLEEQGTTRALVMELVDGEDLSQRIARGAIPLDEALPIARQIAEALEAAHEQGIVHRDLKPANIKVRPDGTVKVLDFGLAKALDPAAVSAPTDHAPTITSPAMTMRGAILGTAAYMAPEQARGKPVDRRADIWAFGVVLYEMLTGARLFSGEEISDVLAAVLTKGPDWTALPPAAPEPIRRLLRRCLEKDRKQRLGDISVARLEIQDALNAPHVERAPIIAHRPRGSSRLAWSAFGGAALVALALAVPTLQHARETPPGTAPRMQVSIDTPVDGNWGIPVLSPDGTKVAFIASGGIAVRAIDSLEGQLIATPAVEGSLAWSPDGQSLAYCSAANELQTVASSGGTPRALGASCGPFVRGTAWTGGGEILFSTITDGLRRIPSAGGTAKPVSTDRDFYPRMLPDGRHYLFLRQTGVEFGIHVGALGSTESRRVTDADSKAEFTSGHLVFMRGTTLMAQPFDPSRLETTGDAFPMASDARNMAVARTAYFSVAPNGLIVYRTGGVGRSALTWVDRSGKELSVVDDANFHQDVALSPDGRMLADTRISPRSLAANLWVTDLSRGVSTRLTAETEQASGPAWSPNGLQVAYGNPGGMFVRESSGSGSATQLTTIAARSSGRPYGFASWFPDGRSIAMVIDTDAGAPSLSTVSIDAEHKTVPYLLAAAAQPAVSPDGRWMAYAAEVSSQFNVFVESIPTGRGKWRISNAGGAQPLWRRDGRELFYRADDGGIMAVPMTGGPSFSPGAPIRLFTFDSFGVIVARRQFTVSPDGQRFLINKSLPERGRTILLQNWLAGATK